MTRFRVGLAAIAVAAAATFVVIVGPGSADGDATDREPMLVAMADGVEIRPLLSTGDTVGGYQMTGIPDGLGAYRSPDGIELFMNHELDGTNPEGVGARISHLKLDDDLGVTAGSYPVDGSEGFLRFCSATLRVLDGTPMFFTGEETTDDDGPPAGGRGGSSLALDATTGEWTETPQFGRFQHENVVPLTGMVRAVFISPEDLGAGDSQLYSYTASSFGAAIAGRGTLRVWKARAELDGDPSTGDIQKGETLRGRFVKVRDTANRDADTLEARMQARDAFDFVRLEDAAQDSSDPGAVWFTETGTLDGETVKGRLYRLDVNPKHPNAARLTVVLDGDAGDDMVNPDNLDVTERSIVIQEDRNEEHRGAEVAGGFARVLWLDRETGTLTPVARVDTPPDLLPGTWESSGVIDASGLLGAGWWLLDVQAHETEAPQPGPSLDPGSAVGEDGQLLAMRIPGS